MIKVTVEAYRDGRNWIRVGDTVKVVFHTKQKSCLGRVTGIQGEADTETDAESLELGRVVVIDITEVAVTLTTQYDRIGRAVMAGTARTVTPDCIHRVVQTHAGHRL